MVQNLNKTVGDHEIIKDFSMDIDPGEVMCLLGMNGSGKTTLINLLTGLIEPDEDSGDTLIRTHNGEVNLRENPKGFRSYIRLCQQSDFLFEELTVREHL